MPALLEQEELEVPSRALSVVLTAWAHYRQGFLPASGGTSDQPWILLRCLEACEGARTEYEAEQYAEMRSRREESSGVPRRARAWRIPEGTTAADWERKRRPVE